MAGYEQQIDELITMLRKKDADGIDRYLYRYEDKGFAMLAIAIFHGLRQEVSAAQERQR